jgi:hypothetical protein
MTGDDHRAAYISGLRDLADTLETFGSLQLPYEGNRTALTFHYLSGIDPAADLIAAAHMIPCAFTSRIRAYGDGHAGEDERAYLDLDGELAGVKITLTAFRKDTCVRVDGGWRIPEAITSVAPEAGVTA